MRRAPVRGRARRWTIAFLGAVFGATLIAAAGARAQPPEAAPPRVLDGPSSAIAGLSQMSIARDGTGGLVYVKQVGGSEHVFASRLVAGVFGAPQQLDGGLPTASSQPVIAAGNGGLVVIAFVNAGGLYVVERLPGGSAYIGPTLLASGGSNPAIAMSNLGKAYLAFTAPGSGGADVRCAYYAGGSWAIESAPLDANPGDAAGVGSGRPAVAAAGDGVGIVAWGETGHIFTRRVWGTSPSVVYEQADVPSVGGWREVRADEPAIGSGGDSSFAAVAFRELLSNGSQTQQRVLMQRLRASSYLGPVAADALTTPGAEGAAQPRVAVDEYGEGLVTSARDSSHETIAMSLSSNEAPGVARRVDTLANGDAPDPVPTGAGFHSGLVAWQQDPGVAGGAEIRASYYEGGSFDPEGVISTPALGPADAADGLVADGDIRADVAIAWVQGTVGARAIVTEQMYQPPGAFGARNSFLYERTARTTFSWSPAREPWGPLTYTLAVDGTPVTRTAATTVSLGDAQEPELLGQGPHTWQVTATNPAGQARTAAPAIVFVDTIAPLVTVRLRGRRLVGSQLRLTVSYSDATPPLSPTEASGVNRVRVRWGDGSSELIHHHGRHLYLTARRYRIVVIVSDRAGNRTRVVLRLKISQRSRRRHRHG